MCACVHVCVCVYREKERQERERDRNISCDIGKSWLKIEGIQSEKKKKYIYICKRPHGADYIPKTLRT